MKKIDILISKLQETFHLHVRYVEKDLQYSKSIPMAIKSNYDIFTIDMLGTTIVVLHTKDTDIKSIKKHLHLFEDALSMPIVFSSETVTPSMQKYLIDEGIPFITEQSIYLPQLFMHLQTIKSPYTLNKNDKLSKLAQVLLISLITNNKYSIDINAGAEQFKVSTMSMSRTLKELALFEYLDIKTEGRKKYYYLAKNLDTEKLLNTMKSPVMETVYLKQDQLQLVDMKVKASYAALSVYTNITNYKPIYAMEKRYFYDVKKEHSEITLYDNEYDSEIVAIELWRYDPHLIQDNITDMISLYLSLKENVNNNDSRILDAMDELYQKIEEMINDTRHR
jgi:hypothetical protein